MKLLPSVVHVEHRGDYRLYVVFSDGSTNTIDFARWLDGPVFEPLRDVEFFKRVFIDGGTVAWPNGADIRPRRFTKRPVAASGLTGACSRRRRVNHRRVPPMFHHAFAAEGQALAGLGRFATA